MTDLRAFLHRQIEAFLDFEFGTATQNATPRGVRHAVWTPAHTDRLVAHLAGNWEMVEVAEPKVHGDKRHGFEPTGLATHRAGCAYCPAKFDCTCDNPGQRHMCPRCDDAAEESKRGGAFMASHIRAMAKARSHTGPDEETPDAL
jgi:hypothetical protein